MRRKEKRQPGNQRDTVKTVEDPKRLKSTRRGNDCVWECKGYDAEESQKTEEPLL